MQFHVSHGPSSFTAAVAGGGSVPSQQGGYARGVVQDKLAVVACSIIISVRCSYYERPNKLTRRHGGSVCNDVSIKSACVPCQYIPTVVETRLLRDRTPRRDSRAHVSRGGVA